MSKIQILKNVSAFVVTAAVTSVVSHVTKAALPADPSRIVKVYNVIGTTAIGDVLGRLASDHINGQIDAMVRIKDVAKSVIDEQQGDVDGVIAFHSKRIVDLVESGATKAELAEAIGDSRDAIDRAKAIRGDEKTDLLQDAADHVEQRDLTTPIIDSKANPEKE